MLQNHIEQNALNLVRKTDEGLNKLKRVIIEQMEDGIKLFGAKIATSYQLAVEAIDALVENGKDTINQEEFTQLCRDVELEEGGEQKSS